MTADATGRDRTGRAEPVRLSSCPDCGDDEDFRWDKGPGYLIGWVPVEREWDGLPIRGVAKVIVWNKEVEPSMSLARALNQGTRRR